MDIIIISNRLGKSRNLTLGGWQLVVFVLLLSWAVWMAAIVLQYALVRFAPEGLTDGVRSLLSAVQSEEQKKQQSYVNNGLDTMATRVGQMQAQVQRLDVLGARLAKLAGMKPEEFKFDEPPAQGGPLVTMPGQEMTLNGLEQQLNRLTRAVNDRNDKLLALQTMLLQNQLSSKSLLSIAPLSDGLYTSNFGWRIDPFTGQNAMHEGVDFMAPEGTVVRASASGVVAFSDRHPQYGNMIELDHGNDIVTRYAHASRLLVKVGQVVRRGEKIALVGSTGRSTGNHLHFEVRYKGIAQNPVRFLPKSQG